MLYSRPPLIRSSRLAAPVVYRFSGAANLEPQCCSPSCLPLVPLLTSAQSCGDAERLGRQSQVHTCPPTFWVCSGEVPYRRANESAKQVACCRVVPAWVWMALHPPKPRQDHSTTSCPPSTPMSASVWNLPRECSGSGQVSTCLGVSRKPLHITAALGAGKEGILVGGRQRRVKNSTWAGRDVPAWGKEGVPKQTAIKFFKICWCSRNITPANLGGGLLYSFKSDMIIIHASKSCFSTKWHYANASIMFTSLATEESKRIGVA